MTLFSHAALRSRRRRKRMTRDPLLATHSSFPFNDERESVIFLEIKSKILLRRLANAVAICAFVLMALWTFSASASAKNGLGPPWRVLPLDRIEIDRDLDARAWKTPYCLRWNDSCTECSRNSVASKIRCEPIKKMRRSAKEASWPALKMTLMNF